MIDRKLWSVLGAYLAVGTALAFLYRDGYSQDSALHYLIARWAWKDPLLFIDVWGRPGFTIVYALPSLFGYPAAKIASVLITAAAAWQTAAAARAWGLERPWLAAPILLASPVLFLLSTETMTEPLFALVFATALRLWFEGKLTAALLLASLLPTIRPEGFFLAAIWAVFAGRRFFWLGLGCTLWWLASWAISGDPLQIYHAWPWAGRGEPASPLALLRYVIILPLIVGPAFVPFAIGGAAHAWRDRRLLPLALVVVPLAIYTFITWLNFSDAGGRSRFIAPVAPAIALFSLQAWNRWRVPRAAAVAIFVFSFAFAYAAVDLSPTNRDWKAFRSVLAHAPKHERFISSGTYGFVHLDRRPDNPFLRNQRERNLEILRALRPGTLVAWDSAYGPWYFHIDAADFRAAGFELVRSEEHDLRALVPWPDFLQRIVGYRRVRVDLLIAPTR